MTKTIPALTFDLKEDSWENSQGFFKRDIPIPTLNEKKNPLDAVSVILKIKYAGVCGSDRGIWHRNSFKDMIQNSLEKEGKSTRILGHEFVGEVIEQGSAVKTLYDIQIGNPVSGDSHVTCGKCFQCRIGEQHVCLNESILGITLDGIYAEYVKIPAKNLWVVDFARVRPEIAAMYDPFGNAVHACTSCDIRGQRVAVFGCGQIGLFSILLLKYFGAAKIIGIDTNEDNLAMAKKLGAHVTIKLNSSSKEHEYDPDQEVIEKIMELTYGKGVDVSMELAGYNSSVNNSIEATRRGGHVILFGLKDGDFTIPKFSRTIVRGLNIHCVIGRRIFSTWQIAQRMLSDQSNGIQDNIFNVILKSGNDTIIPIEDYNNELFEEKMKKHPKLLFKIAG
ncbi:MAG: theronine dehydrogenase [Candidatus Kerfeldbacteria bacterium CG_4_10_14_0_8_um_filter_42_10]|uniref:Theronine dehydrogenase n=1 Tax=Candidatus Kerfeldbacteria bacterium CG_4_10_14_0_8_um_filter_42_10 TaxID=2014248 RepID=A0A2M7RJ19_9BACT|nr:MAG: theronine dehydrogenase [Candidatus Kerfeldbacteria bacterium CG_4_10_14_0_8_um_filter_42_10]